MCSDVTIWHSNNNVTDGIQNTSVIRVCSSENKYFLNGYFKFCAVAVIEAKKVFFSFNISSRAEVLKLWSVDQQWSTSSTQVVCRYFPLRCVSEQPKQKTIFTRQNWALRVCYPSMLDNFFVFSGLEKLQSLQSLHLGFQNCSQQKNVYLQINRITKIHPDAFKNLKNLQVVNLSNNAMTTLLKAIFIDLNILQWEVDLSNNPWICDCRLIAFKHFISFLSESLRKKWSILCNELVSNSGNEEIYWWTPRGRISRDNWLPHIRQDEMKNLIHNIGKTAEALYAGICNKMKTKYLIYDIYVKQKYSPSLVRNARDINAVIRKGRTERDFTLAVCLSVLITFVCAFCLGAFTRPYIGRLWRQICRKKSSASENTFSNQGFSAESLTRENTTNTQINVLQNLSFCSGNSSRNVGSCIVKANSLHKVVFHNSVLALNTEEANQDQSSSYIKVKKEKVSQNSQATNSAGEADIDIDNNDIFSAMSDHQCHNKAFQRELSNNDISSRDDSKYLFNEDSGKSRFSPIANRFNMDSYSLHIESSDLNSPFARETNFPFSELDVKDNIDMLNNSENFILPSSCESGINIENSHTYQTQKNSASIQELKCKEENTRNKDNPVDMFNDSSSTDEGSAFALSDSSSLTESELGQSNAGDDHHLTNSSVTEQVISLNIGITGKFTTLPQSPTITTGFQDIMQKHQSKNETYSETAIISGSGTGMSETYSSVLHIDSSHIDISDISC
uniref:Leucine rich repeat containing 66 n=1 Tax=Gopherus agassizii TaxID=38772 RepID=A0A452GZI2_9SAUR